MRGTPTAVVVGHRGQDGSLLRQRLEREGTRVIGIGRPESAETQDSVPVSVADPAAVRDVIVRYEPDEIFYLAASHASSEGMVAVGTAEAVRESWATNVTGFVNIAEALQAAGSHARLLLAASALVYAPSSEPIDESAPLQPDTVYGATKAAAMLAARAYRAQGVPIYTAVLFQHESGLRPESYVASKVVRTALRIASGSTEHLVLGAPQARVDWTLAVNAVDAMLRMMRQAPPDEYVVASGQRRTVLEFATAVMESLDLDAADHIRTDEKLLKRAPQTRTGDSGRLTRRTGWSGEMALEEFVNRLIAEHRFTVDGACQDTD